MPPTQEKRLHTLVMISSPFLVVYLRTRDEYQSTETKTSVFTSNPSMMSTHLPLE